MENNFKVAWKADTDRYGRYGYPIFWLSSDTFEDNPIVPPFTIDSTPGLLFGIACYYGQAVGAACYEYCLLMTNGYGLKKLHEAGNNATGLVIEKIGIANILDGNATKYAAPYAFAIQNPISRTWILRENVFYSKESFSGIAGGLNEQTRLDNIKKTANWATFETDLREVGATDKGIEIIKKHSCLLYLTSNGVSNGDESILGLMSRSGAGNGIYYGNAPNDYVHFSAVSISDSEILPQQFYYKTNSYANCYNSPSICVTKLWIDFCDGEGFKERPLPPCITGLNPPGLNSSEENIETFFEYKSIKSEYIGLKSKISQEVSTPLVFGGNLAIPEATKLNEMARLSQLPNKDKILRGIVYEK